MLEMLQHSAVNRRQWLRAAGVLGTSLLGAQDASAFGWGESEGYPSCLEGKRFTPPTRCRVGTYSGGYENLIPSNVIHSSSSTSNLSFNTDRLKKSNSSWLSSTPESWVNSEWTTGLLIAHQGEILFEGYGYERTKYMRLTSWSMAKSVTSILLGICLDKKLIHSYDDPAKKYVPELNGTLHGDVTLRNLTNMCSGASINHDRDNNKIYPSAINGKNTSIKRTVMEWNFRAEDQGVRYNYNELCPLAIGMVIRAATGTSLSEFASENLWKPLGAEADAYWLTDSEKCEFNCIGFSARLRDWARLGMMIVNRGKYNGQRIVSEKWIDEITSWSQLDMASAFGNVALNTGYKSHFWHAKSDGSRPYMNGAFGQRLLMDMNTKTVLVRTAIEAKGRWETGLFDLFDRITRIS